MLGPIYYIIRLSNQITYLAFVCISELVGSVICDYEVALGILLCMFFVTSILSVNRTENYAYK